MRYINENMGSYNLHLINTKKFKTTSVQIMFRRNLDKKEITIRRFLSKILIESTKQYPTSRLLEIETEREFGVALGTEISHAGKQSILTFKMKTLNESYTETGMFKKNIDLLFNIINDPNVLNNKFNSSEFKIIRNVIESEIKSIKDDPKSYSITRMLEEMEADSPISYRFAYQDDLDKINESNLYEYYKSVVNNDVVDVFILGDIKLEQAKELFEGRFGDRKTELESAVINHLNYRLVPKQQTELENIKQAKLSIGYKPVGLTDYEMNYVMGLYALILGGPTYSKLFQSVREKNSLAYYVQSNYIIRKNILLIASGINKENTEKALSIINDEMNNMANGEISEVELDNARKDIVSIIKDIEDDPIKTIQYYVNKVLYNKEDIQDSLKIYNKVSKDDIVKVAKKIKLDTIFLLYGDDKNEEDSD